jgi:hypothetical protein
MQPLFWQALFTPFSDEENNLIYTVLHSFIYFML